MDDVVGRLRRLLVGDWRWEFESVSSCWTATHDRGLWFRLPCELRVIGETDDAVAVLVREAVLDAVEAGRKGEVEVRLLSRVVIEVAVERVGPRFG